VQHYPSGEFVDFECLAPVDFCWESYLENTFDSCGRLRNVECNEHYDYPTALSELNDFRDVPYMLSELNDFRDVVNSNPHLQSTVTKEFTECIACKKRVNREYSEYVFRDNTYIKYNEIDTAVVMARDALDHLRMSGKCFGCNS
jgi:hypothetical protein